VSEAVPFEGPHYLSAGFLPTSGGSNVPMLLCLPGGTYTKRIGNLEVPDTRLSFAAHMANAACSSVAVDHLAR